MLLPVADLTFGFQLIADDDCMHFAMFMTLDDNSSASIWTSKLLVCGRYPGYQSDQHDSSDSR